MLVDVFHQNQAFEFKGVIHHQQALQPVFVQQGFGFLNRGALGHGDEFFALRHDVANGHIQSCFKADVAPRHDAGDLAAFNHRKARYAQLFGQLLDLQHGGVGCDDNRIA